MARREYTSGRPTTLASPFAIGAGTFTIADDGSETTWPTGADHDFWVTIDAGTAQEERVLCSGRSVRVVTIASGGRGQDGTSESNHSAGATVWPSWSATDADESNEHINLTTGVHGYTATAAEINILDGATLSTAELNILDGVTATAAEINILDGVIASTAELNYVDGVTSSIQTQINTNTPVGTIVMYGGTTNPTGWLLCNGQATPNPSALRNLIGANVPDLMGRAPIGYGAGSGLTSRTTIGQKISNDETVTLTEAQIPSHTHVNSRNTQTVGAQGAPVYAIVNQGDFSGPDSTTATGGSQAHNNMQPSTVVNFIIKT
jgi:microcystin-dependent protein